jgi:RPA family protein
MYDVWKAVLEMSRTVASRAFIKELERAKHSSSTSKLQKQPYWHYIHTTDSANVQNIFLG